jgi:hypothetical protein
MAESFIRQLFMALWIASQPIRCGFAPRYRGGGPGAYIHFVSMRGEGDDIALVTGAYDDIVRAYDAFAGLGPVRMLDLRKVTSVRPRG